MQRRSGCDHGGSVLPIAGSDAGLAILVPDLSDGETAAIGAEHGRRRRHQRRHRSDFTLALQVLFSVLKITALRKTVEAVDE